MLRASDLKKGRICLKWLKRYNQTEHIHESNYIILLHAGINRTISKIWVGSTDVRGVIYQ